MPQDTLLSKGFNGVLKAHCQKTGWEEVGFEVIASDSTDFSAVLTKMKEKKAQVICTFWDVAQGGTIFLKQWASMKVPALIVGFVVGACSPRGWDLIGSEIEYCIQTEAPIGSAIPLAKVPKAKEFIDRFVKKYANLHQEMGRAFAAFKGCRIACFPGTGTHRRNARSGVVFFH
jgi:branched-chain amino acid transport system substrate-binding protein